MPQELIVQPDEEGQRLDVWCVSKFPGWSRAALQKNIKQGSITVNGKRVKRGQVIHKNNRIQFVFSEKSEKKDISSSVAPLPPPDLPIIFENEHVVVVNKPAGVAVYAGDGQEAGTVADWFRARYPEAGIVGGDSARPGIVHRLDKDTSGVLVLAKTEQAHEQLSKQFARRHVKKEYLAMVFGVPTTDDGRITRPLGRSKRNPLRRTIDEEGRPAVTEWKLEEKFGDKFALLTVWPLTGRMHQIRAHLHFLGYPIVGDKLYTIRRQQPPVGVRRQLLHASSLSVTIPSQGRRVFSAPLPADFEGVLEQLRHDVR